MIDRMNKCEYETTGKKTNNNWQITDNKTLCTATNFIFYSELAVNHILKYYFGIWEDND